MRDGVSSSVHRWGACPPVLTPFLTPLLTPLLALFLTPVARLLCALLLAAAPAPARGDALAATPPPEAIANMTLEQLRDVVVTAVSRTEDSLASAPASVVVISREEIRRSGVRTLAEALRLAPTLQVARADGNQYAISARGFNNVLANKMLVLIDGRTLYTPLFSGVFWEAQEVDLDSVERIEVVTGPSTAMWGSNAVNGLIHVIMREAAAVQRFSVDLDAGNAQRVITMRDGFALGEDAYVRAYAKAYERSDTERADRSSVEDGAHGQQVGFRADWKRVAGGTATLQGDTYVGTIDQPPARRRFDGANVAMRWQGPLGERRQLDVQATLERTHREHRGQFEETLQTIDLVGQVGLQPWAGHQVLLGAGYRHAQDDVQSGAALAFIPGERSLEWARLFVQDQVALLPQLELTASASVERNPYTAGTEVLPSVRVAWQPMPEGTAWLAWSRATRAPSRIDREVFQPAAPPYAIAGGPDFESEIAQVTEVGWRAQHGPGLSYSLTLYQQNWRRLRSVALTAAGPQFQNGYDARTHGGEAWVRWLANNVLRFDAGGGWLREKFTLRPGAVDLGGTRTLGNDPSHWWSLRSTWDIGPTTALSVGLRHSAALPDPVVPEYTAVDARFVWLARRGLELAVAVHNVTDPRHVEWGSAANRVELQRAVQLQLRWQP
jgi:iron complex outermembrane receptor protein